MSYQCTAGLSVVEHCNGLLPMKSCKYPVFMTIENVL